jgi:lipopolysaccharide export system permease protein
MDEFIGKGLGVIVLSELMFYFSINITQTALPLAVLLSSLMAFGNLGEFSELTAIKGAGVSLLRALRPAFILTIIITVLAFLNNNYIVTKANLKAYSLLYDIKKHKPSLDIREGTFYNGIPEFSIKVNKKYPDGETLGDIIIYNHTGKTGNNIVTFADSGRMYSVLNNRYLMFELFNGKRYEEIPKSASAKRDDVPDFLRNDFSHSKLVLSLASFDFKKSKEDLWTSHYYMKNIHQLKTDVDSMDLGILDSRVSVFDDAQRFFGRYYRDRVQMPPEYVVRKQYRDSLQKVKQITDSVSYRDQYNRGEAEELKEDSIDMLSQVELNKKLSISKQVKALADIPVNKEKPVKARKTYSKVNNVKPPPRTAQDSLKKLPVSMINVDSIFQIKRNKGQGLRFALSETRNIKNKLNVQASRLRNQNLMITRYKIEVNKKYAQAFACLVMFLIGAPLGAIIKKGGLGVPVIISIVFFILYYVMSITGKKWAEEGVITPFMGIWGYSFILLPVGFFFLRQAKNDARLLESDFYAVVVEKLRTRFFKKSRIDD